MKRFSDLTEQEVLALAITNEEEDSRIYRGFAEGLREQFPASAKVFDEMAEEEVRHRTMLFDLYRAEIRRVPAADPPAGREGLHPAQRAVWLMRPLGLDEVRKFAENMEYEAARFYRKAAENARDASVRQLLDRARRGRSRPREPRAEARAEDPRPSARAPKKTRPRGACSCCNTCSRASPG